MGPRSRDRGNHVADRGYRGAPNASMGPRSRDRGNPKYRSRVLGEFPLQWGRDHVIAEIVGRGLPLPLHLLRLQWGRDHVIAEMVKALCPAGGFLAASMGPRSRDRGNAGSVLPAPAERAASMGPRSRDRGNPGSSLLCSAHLVASMGPRSRDRGNGAHLGERGEHIILLQWGRDHVIAEIVSANNMM